MARVDELRRLADDNTGLATALQNIKTYQSSRFAHTYQDLLASKNDGGCARFFLEELYSERDYSLRDAQFAKVAGAIELTFPKHVIDVAVALAELHATTERLDHAMARCWHHTNDASPNQRYLKAWNSVGEPATRDWQLQTVLRIGQSLAELTQKRGLRVLLKVMRRPADIAGLGDLQTFLEIGFDRFGLLTETDKQAKHFLATIHEREKAWIANQFVPKNGFRKAKNAQS